MHPWKCIANATINASKTFQQFQSNESGRGKKCHWETLSYLKITNSFAQLSSSRLFSSCPSLPDLTAMAMTSSNNMWPNQPCIGFNSDRRKSWTAIEDLTECAKNSHKRFVFIFCLFKFASLCGCLPINLCLYVNFGGEGKAAGTYNNILRILFNGWLNFT